MRLEPITEEAVARVALSMRKADAAEIFAVRWRYDPLRMAQEIAAMTRIGVVGASPDGTPICVLCAIELTPGLFSLGFFATDAWPSIARPFTRWARAEFKSKLIEAGGQRAEVWTHDAHSWAHRWLRHFGFRAETSPVRRGRNGERYMLFGWEVGRDEV